jgi:hypothetical protein
MFLSLKKVSRFLLFIKKKEKKGEKNFRCWLEFFLLIVLIFTDGS